jgi:hypothetical protein
MIWPLVSIDNRLFLRGLDVTDCYCDDPDKTGLELEYDETWHARTDESQQMPEQRENEGVTIISDYVDRWLPPAEAVKLYSDTEVLGRDLLDRVNRATVVIVPTINRPSKAEGA